VHLRVFFIFLERVSRRVRVRANICVWYGVGGCGRESGRAVKREICFMQNAILVFSKVSSVV